MDHERERKVLRQCERCSGEFLARVRQVKRGRGRYCSRVCSNRSYRNAGTANGNATLTWNAVVQIRGMVRQGSTHAAAAKLFHTTPSNVDAICLNLTWKPKNNPEPVHV